MQQTLEKQKTQSRRQIYPSLSIRMDRLDRMLDMMLEYQTQILYGSLSISFHRLCDQIDHKASGRPADHLAILCVWCYKKV